MEMTALEVGNTISAGEHFQTADFACQFTKFILVGDANRRRCIREEAERCRNLALPDIDL